MIALSVARWHSRTQHFGRRPRGDNLFSFRRAPCPATTGNTRAVGELRARARAEELETRAGDASASTGMTAGNGLIIVSWNILLVPGEDDTLENSRPKRSRLAALPEICGLLGDVPSQLQSAALCWTSLSVLG